MKCQQNPRPPNRPSVLIRLITVQGAIPFVDRRPLIRRNQTDGSQRRDDNGRYQAAFAESSPALRQQIDREHLQHEIRCQRWRQRQQVLPVALRMQRVTMVIGVAAGIIEGIPPTDQAEEIEEDLVQPLGFEDGAMPQLVRRCAGEEAGHGTVKEKRDQHSQPQLIPPKAKYQRAGEDK